MNTRKSPLLLAAASAPPVVMLLAATLLILGPQVPLASGQVVIDWQAYTVAPLSYFDPANWMGGQVPDTSDESARFNLPSLPGTFGEVSVGFLGGPADPMDVRVGDLLMNLGDVTFVSATDMDLIVEHDLVLSGGDLLLRTDTSNDELHMAVNGQMLVNHPSSLVLWEGTEITTGLGVPVTIIGGEIALGGGEMDLGGEMVIDGGQFDCRQCSNGQFQPRGGIVVAGGGRLIFREPFTVPVGSTISVESAGTLTVPGSLTLEPESVLRIDGGSVSAPILAGSGSVDFAAGALIVSNLNGLAIGPGLPLGPTVLLGDQHILDVSGPLQVNAGGTLLLDNGADVSAAELSNFGGLVGAGTFVLGSTVTNHPGGVIRVPALGTLRFAGLTFNASNYGHIVLGGGTLQFDGPLINFPSGNVQGYGVLDPTYGLYNQGFISLSGGPAVLGGDLTNESAGTITATGEDELAFLGAVTNAGVINVDRGGPEGHTTFSRAVSNDGLMRFSGGVTDVFGEVTNNATGTIHGANSAIITFYRPVTNNGAVVVDDYSTALFLGTVSGNGSFPGQGTHVLAASVSPGASAGQLRFGGDVLLGSGALVEIEIEGLLPGEFDRLIVDGHLQLSGTLDVQLATGEVLPAGAEFDILDWSTLAGTFSSLLLPSLPGLAWDTSQLYTTGTLLVTSASTLPGDFNGDGTVDAADYALWRKNPGGIYTPEDLNTWRAHFGQTSGSAASLGAGRVSNAVPQPAAIWLALSGAAIIFWTFTDCPHRRAKR